MRVLALFLILIMLILSGCVKLDVFPVTGIVGSLEASEQVVESYCQNKTFEEVYGIIASFKYQLELSNEIILPDVLFKRKYGDCEDFAIANAFVAKYYGYTPYIVYLIINGKILHYSTVIEMDGRYRLVEHEYISDWYSNIEDTEKIYNSIGYSAKIIKIKSLQKFLSDLEIR
ncbi:MAG: hypothetical protein H0Z24_03985 [Thermosipho sp. (in: Bacteria)]|nr:hypothetical protein [Thermosipho sp. (in: thermotogales)]